MVKDMMSFNYKQGHIIMKLKQQREGHSLFQNMVQIKSTLFVISIDLQLKFTKQHAKLYVCCRLLPAHVVISCNTKEFVHSLSEIQHP